MDTTPTPLLPPRSESEKDHTIYIREFTRPGDPDSASGIRKAFKVASETGAKRVQFESGRYRLLSHIQHPTEGLVHDAGSRGTQPSKQCHLLLSKIPSLTISGVANEKGDPETILVGWNHEENHLLLPAILWCESCPNLQIENLAFTREPSFSSAGEIISKDCSSITVRPFDDCSGWDGMGAYCANQFTRDGETLIGESISYGNGAQSNWRQISPTTFRLVDSRAANMVECGNLLSWHQGARTDFQVYIAHCDNLRLSQLQTYNSNGFCLLTENCRNITARKISFLPKGNRLFTGPRDAWKIFKCGGILDIEELSVRGVRMDGQNMHSNWAYLREIISNREVILYCRYTYAPILPGTKVEFHDGIEEETRTVSFASWEGPSEDIHLGHLYRVRFNSPIPSKARKGALCAVQCWEADRYSCRDSEFTNIAGAGHLSRYDHLDLSRNSYRNIMNPGILLGAEMQTHAEGGHSTDVLIKGCHFDNCGFFPRYETMGCIGVHSLGFDQPLNRNIEINGNHFQNSEVAVHLMTARDVRISGNSYENIGELLRVDPLSTADINSSDI